MKTGFKLLIVAWFIFFGVIGIGTGIPNNPIATDPMIGVHITHDGKGVNNLVVQVYNVDWVTHSRMDKPWYTGTTDGTDGYFAVRPGYLSGYGIGGRVFSFMYLGTQFNVQAVSGQIVEAKV